MNIESVKTRVDFETKDSMSYDQEKGMSLGDEKDLKVERIKKKRVKMRSRRS